MSSESEPGSSSASASISLLERESAVSGSSQFISRKRKRGELEDGNNIDRGDAGGRDYGTWSGDEEVSGEEEVNGGGEGGDEDYEDYEEDGEDGEDGYRGSGNKSGRSCSYAVGAKPSHSKRGRSKRRRLDHVAGYMVPPCPRGGLSFASWSVAHSVQGRKKGKAVEFIGVLGNAGGDYREWGDSGSLGWIEKLVAEFSVPSTRASVTSGDFLENSLESLLNRCRRGDIVEAAAAFVQYVNHIQLLSKVKRWESLSALLRTCTDPVYSALSTVLGTQYLKYFKQAFNPPGWQRAPSKVGSIKEQNMPRLQQEVSFLKKLIRLPAPSYPLTAII